MQPAEQKQLLSLLDELSRGVEELLLAGLTTASKSTVERIDVSFKEASRMKLLRLGSTLRIANEEISRFTAGSAQFSSRRLAFFLGRAWLLATSMRRAISEGDSAALDKLMSTPATQPVANLKVVTLGVAKRVVPGSFASFDFRLRADRSVEPAGGSGGSAMVWSCVFPHAQRPGAAHRGVFASAAEAESSSRRSCPGKESQSKCRVGGRSARQPIGATRLVLGETQRS